MSRLRRSVCIYLSAIMLSCFTAVRTTDAASPRFVRSESGPSGKVVDNRFQFDEVRNRFVYPQDKFLTVYFEWEAVPGNHVLTAYWKDPTGSVASISPDVKMETRTLELHAYWIFEVAPGLRGGVWTVEVRIDGEPSGTHSFELVMPEAPAKPVAAAATPKLPTLDEMYASIGRSLAWVHKLDDGGHPIDTALGFVIGPDKVATAFQAIDSATRFEVVFADGSKVESDEVWAADRLQDWAILKVATGRIPSLRRMQNGTVPVGERYIVFNVENQTVRVIGGVDITGKRSDGILGDRIQLGPPPAAEAVGGPLLSPSGEVAGVVGGSVIPGARFGQHALSVNPALWPRLNDEVAAIPIVLLPAADHATPATLPQLLSQGLLTPPLAPVASLVFGAATRNVPKGARDENIRDTAEFSHGDGIAWVYTLWQKKEKNGKGLVSAKVYDQRNRLLVNVAPKKIGLSDVPLRVAFDFPLQSFAAGVYRVDVLWNDQPAWRTFFRVTD